MNKDRGKPNLSDSQVSTTLIHFHSFFTFYSVHVFVSMAVANAFLPSEYAGVYMEKADESIDDMLHPPNIYIYSKSSAAAELTDASALIGGSIKRRRELKTMMNMVNTISDLQGSPCFLTSLSPSSWPLPDDDDASFS